MSDCSSTMIIQVWSDFYRHFYAHEHPELLARDLKAMFGEGGGAFGVVKGKNGY